MSTWGPGNFDSEMNSEWLQDFQQELVDRIRTIIQNPEKIAPDASGEWDMMPNLDILTTVATKHRLIAPLTVDEVQSWKQKYLDAYAKYSAALPENAKFDKLRIPVIRRTFDSLIRCVKKAQS